MSKLRHIWAKIKELNLRKYFVVQLLFYIYIYRTYKNETLLLFNQRFDYVNGPHTFRMEGDVLINQPSLGAITC